MKILRSFIISFVLLSFLSMSILPVSSDDPLFAVITPIFSQAYESVGYSDPNYIGTMNIPTGVTNYYYLKVTIPANYTLIYPTLDNLMGTFTFNGSNNLRIRMFSTGVTPNKVKFNYSINNQPFIDFSPSFSQDGSVYIYSHNSKTLRFLEPDSINNVDGYVEFELGTLGPLTSGNIVTVDMTPGTVRNPSFRKDYSWNAEARTAKGGSGTISTISVTIE